MLNETEMKSLMDVEEPNGHKIDCAVFIHDDNYNLKVDTDCIINLQNLFNNH